MRLIRTRILEAILVIFCAYGYIAGCTHDDEVLETKGPDITRGEEKVTLTDSKTTFDKSHSNVGWESLYLGSTATLTGRFDKFGFEYFDFDESNPANTKFKAWVWLNSVNTSEPGRDDGCLLGTYGTDNAFTTETDNIAEIISKSVEFSTTDKGYIVHADLIFHDTTKAGSGPRQQKEITCKLNYDGKSQATSGGNTLDVFGFSLNFQFLAKTDFLIQSTSIGDNVDVKCNAIIRRAQ